MDAVVNPFARILYLWFALGRGTWFFLLWWTAGFVPISMYTSLPEAGVLGGLALWYGMCQVKTRTPCSHCNGVPRTWDVTSGYFSICQPCEGRGWQYRVFSLPPFRR